VLLAIDDTGSGHASFSHVLAMRPDLVKLDQAIIHGIELDSARRALVRAVVAFAEEEGLALVAEGIETPRQMDCVAELGVAYAQGYHVGRPKPLDEQPGLLAHLPGGEAPATVMLWAEAALRRPSR
jgi:EAL domain-containing protein (putative c-di-GMP-specific phosphodiesterase class I)